MVWFLPYLVATTAAPIAPRIAEVSLFQNGYAFVRREVDVTASGEVRIEPLPRTVLGTFRFASSPGITIRSVVVDEEIKGEPAESDSLDELLALNLNRPLTLILTDGRSLEGEITRASSSMTVTFMEGNLERTLPRNLIREVVIAGTLKRATERKQVVRSLRIQYDATKPGKLILRSLEPGLGWVPSYEATLLDDRSLRLTGRATIANDLGDLERAEAELVTGAPNVRYSAYLDPLVGTTQNRNDLRDDSPYDLKRAGEVTRMMDGLYRGSGDMASNDLVEYAPGAPVEMPAVGQGLGTAQELFRHRLPATTLRKGARAQVALFDFRADYKEIFTWDVAISENRQPFWRSVRFSNLSDRPLATGPASAFRDEQLLGQDLLRPTPVKEEAELRLTLAADVRGEALEEETDRAMEPGEPGKPGTFRSTVKGTLRVTNTKNRAIPVRIRRVVTGEVTSKGEATERRSAAGLRPRDPVTELTWTLEIPAGQTKTLNYTYRSTVGAVR